MKLKGVTTKKKAAECATKPHLEKLNSVLTQIQYTVQNVHSVM